MPKAPLALMLLVVLLGLQARSAPDSQDAAWVALDISAAMNYDAICTPNELLRCRQLYLADMADGDTDQDLQGSVIDASHRPHLVFGGHRMGKHWTSLCLAVAGRTYVDVFGRQKIVPADGGVPPDGRVGIYRLYMDELEHDQWHCSAPGEGKAGRNAVFYSARGRDRTSLTVDLPARQQRRYRELNLLFAGSARSAWSMNDVRLKARYTDDSEQVLWRGRMGSVRGNTRIGWSRVEYRTLPGQREALDMGCSVDSVSSGATVNASSRAAGDVALLEFESPLNLDPTKTLAALVFERAEEDPRETWRVFIFAVSALPAD